MYIPSIQSINGIDSLGGGFSSSRGRLDPARFVVIMDTRFRSDTTVMINVNARTGSGNRFIDWGDGTVTVENSANPTHTYATDGVYKVQMYGGTTTILGNTAFTADSRWTQPLIQVVQWGKAIGWTSFRTALRSCSRNVLVPDDFPRVADGYAANVTNMEQMLAFGGFNRNIGNWNVSNVSNMRGLFWVSPFNQDIGAWPLRTAGVAMDNNMLNSSGMSTENYSRTLIGWANSVSANNNAPANVSLAAIDRRYNDTAYVSGQTYNDAVAARAYLTGASPNPAWTISDGGPLIV